MGKRIFAVTDYEMSLDQVAVALWESECEEARAKGETPPAKPLSRERIRQLEVIALRKIRRSLGMPISQKEASQR